MKGGTAVVREMVGRHAQRSLMPRSMRRLYWLVSLALDEWRRSQDAARRYDEMRRSSATARADIPRRVFLELYSVNTIPDD